MATKILCNLCFSSMEIRSIFHRNLSIYQVLTLCSRRYIHISSIKRQNGVRLSNNLRESYALLGVSENSSVSDIREAYLRLARLHHPDSGGKTADSKKFAEIGLAYEAVVKHKKRKDETTGEDENTEEENGDGEEKDFDIRHTAPQHRQYLSYDGVGYGTPSQRQKQHQQHRVRNAAESVLDHQIRKFGESETSIAQPEKKAIKKRIITQAVERLVEDKIQEAMSKGQFTNLPGSGKPLKIDLSEHYLDNSTHRLNKIIIDSGFAPEWITLDKEIRTDIQQLRNFLVQEQVKVILQLSSRQTREDLVKKSQAKITNINHKIDKFNLIVPILNKQRVHISLDREYKRCRETAQTESESIKDKQKSESIKKTEVTKMSHWEEFVQKWTIVRKLTEFIFNKNDKN